MTNYILVITLLAILIHQNVYILYYKIPMTITRVQRGQQSMLIIFSSE